MELTADQRRYLRGLAHHLNPVVMIGNNGLTDSVIREIAVNLDAHELIKVRVLGDDRALREQFLQQICTDLSAEPVQHLGKLLIIFRQADAARTRFTLPGAAKVAKVANKTPAKPAKGSAKG
ncbi:ribosome assembly RNA-binding protein YhbY [Amantichitinum ursilacus]|nr:ribosome assembly RNA-binding protein YhbY [Amantichitinum ursilacus]